MSYGTLAFQIVAAVAKITFMIFAFLMPIASILT